VISFNPQNPFPLLEYGTYTYAEAKEHAKAVDAFLGFEIDQIESKLKQDPKMSGKIPQEKWIGLDAQSFLTPYLEIRTALHLLEMKPGQTLVDLGCGYARMAFVMGKHFSENFFHGYEIVPERFREAERILKNFQYKNVQIELKDLTLLSPIKAEHYFIYDFGSNLAIEKSIWDLQAIAKLSPIQVVARGRASRHLIHQNHPWLCEVLPPRHFQTFSIFRS
jgi:hypothetical protein